jgi:hypothetical protein
MPRCRLERPLDDRLLSPLSFWASAILFVTTVPMAFWCASRELRGDQTLID